MRQILTLIILALLAGGQGTDRAEVQLQAAIKKEVFDGDLKGAIEQYKKVIASYGKNRAVATKMGASRRSDNHNAPRFDGRSIYTVRILGRSVAARSRHGRGSDGDRKTAGRGGGIPRNIS